MSEQFWQAEFMRQLGNVVQFGKVVELDTAAARVRVEVGENKTAWIPWQSAAAGEDRAWSAPEPGEQVVVLAPSGDMAQGVVLRGVYSNSYGAPANTAEKTRFQWKGGAWVELDRQAKSLEVNMPAGGPGIRFVCGSSVVEVKDGEVKITANALTIVAPTTTTTGSIDAAGEVEAGAAGVKLTTHRHTGVTSGPATTAGPVP